MRGRLVLTFFRFLCSTFFLSSIIGPAHDPAHVLIGRVDGGVIVQGALLLAKQGDLLLVGGDVAVQGMDLRVDLGDLGAAADGQDGRGGDVIMNLITKVVLDHLFILLMAIYSIFIQQLSTHNLEM